MAKQIRYSEPEDYFPKSLRDIFNEAPKKKEEPKKPAKKATPKKKTK